MMKTNRIGDEELKKITGGVGAPASGITYRIVNALRGKCISETCSSTSIDTIQTDEKNYRQECIECGSIWYVEL